MRQAIAVMVVFGLAATALGAWGDTSGRILADRDWGNRQYLDQYDYTNAGYAQSTRVYKYNGQNVAVMDWDTDGTTNILNFLANNPLPDPNAGRYLFQLDLTTEGSWTLFTVPVRFNCRTLNMLNTDWAEGDGCGGSGCTVPAPGGIGDYNWTDAWNDYDGAAVNRYARCYWVYDQFGFKVADTANSVQWQDYQGNSYAQMWNNDASIFRNANVHYSFVDPTDPSFMDFGSHIYMELDYDPNITVVNPGDTAPVINDLLYNSINRGIGTYMVQSWDSVGQVWVDEPGTNASVTQLEKFNNGQSPAIIITLAHYGDVNLDGFSDQTDLGLFAQNYEVLGPGVVDGRNWDQGDFSGDGIVDQTDLGLLAQYYEVYGFGGGAVPEPASLVLLAGGAACLLGRRRRRH